ncbi:hypothetical protein BW723_01710 [Polaribacter reichenbachii]|uniref:Serine kinase n=1 Tax=Polaribacter reichenbachii TaxID=996801 RepID=A0A1B8TW71_9FLAO|nr:hypothetical protein [Polaribacter reichenbachii]APZ45088.1 hypothetical protein BW723_01710 [Polaribacter reichenbachii]AUC18950.1 hypothetical protein BTO17_09710 [Polaribacter reichenbachii]OBY63893.1 hypothetical protein LPB301_13990 [Polaribacter reichenbachii]
MKTLYKKVEDKTITWFEDRNEYLVLENTTADVLKRLDKGISVKEIAISLSKKLDVPVDKAADFIINLNQELNESKNEHPNEIINDYRDIEKPKKYEFIKFYKVNNVVFKISFLSETELSLIHHKFEHLVIEQNNHFDNEFEIFINNNFIFLYVNNTYIGSWSHQNVHYFQGKFSMEFIQRIHQKEENEWLGVFHASAVSNGKKSMLFLGDSGNGKSTSLALLQANGFTCLADDFVPVDVKKQEVYSFPAAISIKKNSLDTLLPIYPELKNGKEYNLIRLNKVVRYLKPNNTNYFAHLPCNDLIFIKYEKDSELTCTKISKIDAFQQLIPDSWLSPKTENAQVFLDWFATLNCYQLTYSDNNKMIAIVHKLFNNDL